MAGARPRTISDPWQLSNLADSVAASDSATDLEISSPPLVIVSSRVKSSASLVGCVNPGVAVVKYSYESTSLAKLLQLVATTLKGRLALSIALLVHGQPGYFKICSQKLVNPDTVRSDQELRDFFRTLVSTFLDREGPFARIDLLLCPVNQGPQGEELLQRMRELLQVPVFASSDVLGEYISEGGQEGNSSSVRIGTLYFDGGKLKEWVGQGQQTMALFEKIKTVGKGAYGAAVLYRKKDDDSLVILKEINLLDLSKKERTLALNEIQILSMLDHPSIISYYDHFEEDGVLIIEMEYADGGTLAQLLKQRTKPLSEPEILTLFAQMVDALKYLHDHNILHRDLKTANVFLTQEGIVKLGDFGISKVLSATNQEANTVLGTPYYISPEICEGKHYNAKSDIWALGCILYEMACLQRTFEGTNLPALVHKIVQVSFTPVKGDYSDGFKQLIADMLQKEPELRPSADDIFTSRLPQLLQRFQNEDDPAIFSNDEQDTKTKANSFLYYLEGHSLLLRPVHAPIKAKIDHVAVGFSHILVVTYESTVFSWGAGSRGQLGHGDTEPRSSPQLVEALKGRTIARVECGGEFSVFASDNGLLMSCGRGETGALGHGDFKDCLRPKLIEGLLSHDVTVMSCGEGHVAALTSEHMVFTWGAGLHGRLGTGSEDNCCTPTEIPVHSPGSKVIEMVTDVRCGLDGTLLLTKTGRLFACGSNQDNKLGLNQRETFLGQMKRILNKHQLQVPSVAVATPIKELGKHRVVDMSLGPTHTAVVVETGQLYTFGRNSEGQLCSGNLLPRNMPVPVRTVHAKPTMVTCSELSTIVTTDDNSFLIWGSRPVIKSPITEILAQVEEPPKEFATDPQLLKSPEGAKRRSNSFPQQGSTDEGSGVFSEGSSHQMLPLPLSPLSPELNSSHQSVSSGHMASCEGTPERKPSFEDDYHRSSKPPSSDSINRSNPRVSDPQNLKIRHPSLNFGDVPHAMVPCLDSSRYQRQLSEQLASRLKQRETANLPSQHPTSGGKSLRRGASMSNCDFSVLEGVVLKPTPIDLVGRSGILNSLSEQGLRDVKLEGVSCFGSNLVVLIEARVLGEAPPTKGGVVTRGQAVKTFFHIGRKLVDRRAARHKVPSPILQDLSPVIQRRSRDKVLPSIEEPATSGVGGAHDSTTTTNETTLSENSMIATWLRNDFDEAVRLGQGGHAPKESDGSRSGSHDLLSLPSSVSPDPKNETSEPGAVPRTEAVLAPERPPLQSRPAVPRGTAWKVGDPEHLSPSRKKNASLSRLGLPSSDVISSTILEQELESDSLSAIGNPQTVPEKDRKPDQQKSSQQNPKMLRVATSVSSIPQTAGSGSGSKAQITGSGSGSKAQTAGSGSGSKARNPLNIKRARSNSDVYGKTTPTRQPPHPKLKGKLSSPDVRGAASISSVVRPSPGARSRPTPSASTQNSGTDVESKKRLGSRALSSSSDPGKGGRERHKSAKSSQSSQAEGVSRQGEEPNGHVTSPESGIDSTPTTQEHCSSSSDGEVFNAHNRSSGSGVASRVVVSKKRANRTGHAIPVTSSSPYAEPVPLIPRPGAKPASRSRTATQEERKFTVARQQEGGKLKEEIEKLQEEQRKTEHELLVSRELRQQELEEERRSSKEREAQLQEEIQQLRSQLEKQSNQNEEIMGMMRSLQRQVGELHPGESPPPSPRVTRRGRGRLRSSRAQRRDREEEGGSSGDINRTRSSFCSLM